METPRLLPVVANFYPVVILDDLEAVLSTLEVRPKPLRDSLMEIKRLCSCAHDSDDACSILCRARNPVVEQLRFAVGTFDTWRQVRGALREGRLRGLAADGFNCLGLDRVFARTVILAPNGERVPIEPLPFPGNAELIACTSGVLADRLTARLHSGAGSLKDALGHWLIPRHAARFEDTVQAGRILFWMQLADSDDERRAYQCLLSHSSDSVGVHDLVAPGEGHEGTGGEA